MTAKVVAHEFPIYPWDTYTLRIPPHEQHALRCPGADSQVTSELVHTQIDRARGVPPLVTKTHSFVN